MLTSTRVHDERDRPGYTTPGHYHQLLPRCPYTPPPLPPPTSQRSQSSRPPMTGETLEVVDFPSHRQRQPVTASLSASTCSRGSWSSLFNTGSIRQFMSGVQESISAPLDTLPVKPAVAIPQQETVLRLPNIDSPRYLRRGELAFSSASYGRRLLAVNQRQAMQEKKLVVEEEPQQQAQRYASTLSNTILRSMTIPLLGQS